VDGRRRVLDVAREAHIAEFDATKILYRLAEAGYLEATTETAASAVADRSRAVLTGMNEIFREVVRAVAAHGTTAPLVADASAFLADATSRYAPLWRGIAVEADGSLDEDRLLVAVAGLGAADAARLDPRGDRPRILLAALRELMFFYLFQAGERLPRDDDESVSQSVKRRLEEVEAAVAPT
jgi:predicted RNA-binding Zn ribbon-like protein